ncbi:MAG: uroporphyrinogen-III synthase [Anaerolineales bacterium]|nr:uroporphyrinogen-III synthase [Anaerolineales bacterium]
MKLANKRVLITRPRAQADEFAAALIAEGAQTIFFPVIEIIPPDDFSELDRALQNLDQYDWLILTSIHGVDAFFKRLEFLGMKELPSQIRVAAVGSKTAQSLITLGTFPDHVPDEFVAEGILSGIKKDISGKKFLLLQSNLARKVLSDQVRSAGGFVDDIVAYHNIASQPRASELDDLRFGIDIITFTSPSTVKNFVDIVCKNRLDPLNLPGNPLFACIGPITKKAAEEAGLTNLVVANEYTTAGLIQVLGNLVYS